MNRILTLALAAILGLTLTGCSTEADSVNENLDKDAESFKIVRRVTFVNGITDQEMLRIEGRCSLEYGKTKIDVTCKVDGEDQSYKRHTLVRSDNVFVVSEQLLEAEIDPNHYKFVVRPQTLIPDIDIDTDSTSQESQND